jgi:co-chaperonin GroES (HSP10)
LSPSELAQIADSVVYSKFAGTEVEVGGKECVLLKVRTGRVWPTGSGTWDKWLSSLAVWLTIKEV